MNTPTAQRLILLLVLPVASLTIGCSETSLVEPESEPGPTAFTITSTLNPSTVSGAAGTTTTSGTFELSGMLENRGHVQADLEDAAPSALYERTSLYGVRTFDGENGTFRLEYYAGLNVTDNDSIHAYGGFEIIGVSGAYEGMIGTGAIDRVVDAGAAPAEITRVLVGALHPVQ